jgi:hypothetical protein
MSIVDFMALTTGSFNPSSPDPERSAGQPDAYTQAAFTKLQVPKQATSVGPRRGGSSGK